MFISSKTSTIKTLYNKFSGQYLVRDDTHMTSMKIVQFAGPPTPLIHLRPKFFHPLDLGRPILKDPPPLSPNGNQSVKRKHNPRMTIICYQVIPTDLLSFSVSTSKSCLAFL